MILYGHYDEYTERHISDIIAICNIRLHASLFKNI